MADQPSDPTAPWKLIGTIAGAVAAVLTVVFLLYPNLKPERHTPPTTYAPPASLGGQVVSVALASRGGAAETPDMVHVQVKITGCQGQDCTLGWSLYRAGTGLYINGQRNALTFTPEAAEDTAGQDFRLPQPPLARLLSQEYFVRVWLYAPNGTELDRRDTVSFVP